MISRLHLLDRSCQRVVRIILTGLCVGLSLPVMAVDFSFSGYGTVGYAQSNNDNAYLRFINSQGNVRQDTVFGAQLDARFSPQWSATIQAKVAPRDNSDEGWQASLAWAFVSWRPSSDWLLRVGKMRAPGYMNAQNMDVGVTYDFARLPTELYGVSPTLDFYGSSVSKTWSPELGDISLEAFYGQKYNNYGRYFIRQGIPGLVSSGAVYLPSDLTDKSLTLTLHRNESIYSIGYHAGTTKSSTGAASDTFFPRVTLAPGIDYYQIFNGTPGPGVEMRSSFNWSALYLGADVALPADFRLIAEYGRERVADTALGANLRGYTLGLLKPVGRWTPYVSYSRLRSEQSQLDLVASLNKVQVPTWLDPSGLLNATQRVAADSILAMDQNTLAIGASFALSPASKFKGEWSRVHIGQSSNFVDSPAGGIVSQRNINVISFSYNFVY